MKTQHIKIVSAASVGAATLVTIGIGAAVGGAIGMSYTLYGAIMGGIIGAIIGYALDYSFEDMALGAAVGAEIGAIIGIIMETINKKDNAEMGIDNSDYGKGASCAFKTAFSHKSDAKDCAHLDWGGCLETVKGFEDITTCMGEGGHPYNTIEGTITA